MVVDPLNVNRRSTEIPFPFFIHLFIFILFFTRSGLRRLVGGGGGCSRTPLATGACILFHLSGIGEGIFPRPSSSFVFLLRSHSPFSPWHGLLHNRHFCLKFGISAERNSHQNRLNNRSEVNFNKNIDHEFYYNSFSVCSLNSQT